MSTVIYFNRKAFVAHVFCVTYQLLIVLYQINALYGRIKNKYESFYYFVVAGGSIHTLVPVFGIFYPVAMYGHIAFCFLVHVLHLTECYIVFSDMKITDAYYITILITVNLLEFGANFAYMFPQVISDQHMVPILVSVEMMALLISILKVRRHESGYHIRQIKVSPESEMMSEPPAVTESQTTTTNPSVLDLEKQTAIPVPPFINKSVAWSELTLNLCTSRFVQLLMVEFTAIVALLMPRMQYGIFTIMYGWMLALALFKCDMCKGLEFHGLALLKFISVIAVSILSGGLYLSATIPLLILVIFNIVTTIITFSLIFVSFRQLSLTVGVYTQYGVLVVWILGAHIAEAISLPQCDSKITGLVICCGVAWAMIVGVMKLKK